MITVYNRQETVEFNKEKFVFIIVNAIIATIKSCSKKPSNYKIDVVLVDNQEITRLNNRFLHKNRVTDVISFDYSPTEKEIFISLEQCTAQAKEYNQTFDQELTRLSIHSTLHCLGYRDDTVNYQKVMWAKQEKIVNQIFPPKTD